MPPQILSRLPQIFEPTPVEIDNGIVLYNNFEPTPTELESTLGSTPRPLELTLGLLERKNG